MTTSDEKLCPTCREIINKNITLKDGEIKYCMFCGKDLEEYLNEPAKT